MHVKPIDEAYKSARKYKCPYCDIRMTRADLINHVEEEHDMMIPEGYTANRVIYDSINGKNYNTCMICKQKVYEWDDKHSRYKNLCNKKSCRDEVRRIALERHMKTYNRPTLLDIPEWQADHMLANRKISGNYRFTDGGVKGYTASYEKKCLEFLDKVMGYKSDEIVTPGPVFYYEFQGKKHFYISDIYIIPANLVIEVKDGGSNPNTRNMPDYRGKQVAKEKMITENGTYNYLRLTDNQFDQLLSVLADIKYDMIEERPVKIHINEVGLAASPAVGAFPRSSDQSVYVVPKMMNSVFDDAPIDFYVQSDDFSENFIGQGSDGRLHLYTEKSIGDSLYVFKYTGKDAKKKFNTIKELFYKNKKLRENVIIEILLGHKPMVLDEILCNESFQVATNPWLDRTREYQTIAENVYSEAMIRKHTKSSLENTMARLRKISESLGGLKE